MNQSLQESPVKDIALKAIMVMPNLLLQKPSQKSKSKNYLSALEKRMELWESGELVELLKEVETIQKCLKATNITSSIKEVSKKFSREMRRGNVRNGIKLLMDNMKMVFFL